MHTRIEGTVQLPPAACRAICNELPRAGSLDAALRIVEQVRHERLGRGQLTVSANLSYGLVVPDGGTIELQRLWTSDAAAYPVAGRKRKAMTPWTQQLLVRAEVFVGEGDAALAQAFDDQALISSLGWHAIVNVPLLDAQGRCLATFNVLGGHSQWRPQDILLIRLLGLLATPAVAHAAAAVRQTINAVEAA